MPKKRQQPVTAEGWSDGIEFDRRGYPVDFLEDRSEYGPVRRCPRCRRCKPEELYTPFAWKNRGQYCRTCRIEDSQDRRDDRKAS